MTQLTQHAFLNTEPGLAPRVIGHDPSRADVDDGVPQADFGADELAAVTSRRGPRARSRAR
jgi:hypothetical protein